MRLTDEMVLQDNNRFEKCNALAELKYCGWEIPHRKSITNDEIRFYAWLCRSAVALLKEQDNCENCAIAIEDRQPVVRCKDCKKRYKKSCGYFYADGRIMCDDWFCADGERR